MSQPNLLQEKFKGFRRDKSREQLPEDALWDVLDYIPDLGAPLRKRGGWATYGASLDSINASATVPKRVFYAPFSTPQVLAWDNNGRLFNLTAPVDVGATTVPLHTPTFFRDLVIWGDGDNAPRKYDGNTVSSLGGSPPTTARCSAVWQERVIFSGRLSTAAEKATIYFSAAGNAESWDTTNAFVRTRDTIQGLAPLGTSIIVFHAGSVTKVYPDGSPPAPPSATGVGNLGQKVLFDDVGIYGPNAFAVKGESVIWADDSGVYSTDGTSLVDLTDRGGIRTYWQDIAPTANHVAVGTWRDYALVSLTLTDGYVDFLLCDLETKGWFRFSNIAALNFSPRFGTRDELYFSNRQTKYVGEMSACFDPSSVNKNDADLDSILPSFDTRYYTFAAGPERIKRVYLTYDLRDASLDNPRIQASYIATPEASSYTTFPGSNRYGETTEGVRRRHALNRKLRGVAFRFVQSGGPSGDTRIHKLEAEVGLQEPSRLV